MKTFVPFFCHATRLRQMPGARDVLSMMAVIMGRRFLRRPGAPGEGLVSEEKPVIITGMQRSGTSLVTRLLVQGGLYVGGSSVDVNCESVHFTRANRAMVGEGAGLLHDYGWAAPKADDFIQARRGYAERAAANIALFFGDRRDEPAWGWKDPRNCLTLPVWLSIYPGARAIHVIRDGRSIAAILLDRFGLHPLFGVALWAHYVTRAERALTLLPQVRQLTVRYEELVKRPVPTLQRLHKFANLETPASLDSMVNQIDRTRAAARQADPRVSEASDHPVLAEHGYR